MNNKWNFLLPTILAMVMIIGMAIGFKLRESTWNKPPVTQKVEYSVLDEILSLVEQKYVDTVNRDQLISGLISDLLVELDPHSFFIAARDLEGVNEGLEGNFEGIGIEFYVLKDTIIVVSPIAGGPSEKLGIMSGDKIIKINDTIVAGIKITNKQVIGKLRGEKGTKVKVSIARNHNEELLDFNIMRDKIPIFSVDVGYRVDKQTGYIKINRFSANTYSEFTHELEELKNQGMENLIIDLRQNPGGYLNAATMIADELLAGQKLLVYTEGKAYERKDYKSRGGGLFEKGDLVVLIDEGSASASEILAGAIQDLDRGTVIGRRSFGKGLVQEQYKLQDGSALRLTVARYYTPSGRSIQKPYDQGNEKYYSEIAARYYDGEFTSEDSITFADSLQYFTSKGKSVYGGGGIMPDIFIAMDTSLHFQRLIRVRGYVPEFIYDFYSKTQDYFTRYSDFDDFNEHFAIADTVFEGFADYAITAGSKFKRADFEDVKPEINVFLKAYLGRQMWKNEGFYPIFNTIDSTYLKGVEIVTSPTSVQ